MKKSYRNKGSNNLIKFISRSKLSLTGELKGKNIYRKELYLSQQ